MNQNIFDRKKQQNEFFDIIDKLDEKITLIFIKGENGSGRTHFIDWCIQQYYTDFLAFEAKSKKFICLESKQHDAFTLTNSIYRYLLILDDHIQHDMVSTLNDYHTIVPFRRSFLDLLKGVKPAKKLIELFDADLKNYDEILQQIRILLKEVYIQKMFYTPLINFIGQQFKFTQKVLFAIDDIQWLDSDSLNALIQIIFDLHEKGYKVCLLATVEDGSSKTNIEKLSSLYDCYCPPPIHVRNLGFDDFKIALTDAKKELGIDVQKFYYDKTNGNFEEMDRVVLNKFDSELNDFFLKNNTDDSQSFSEQTLYYQELSKDLEQNEFQIFYFLAYKLEGIINGDFEYLYRSLAKKFIPKSQWLDFATVLKKLLIGYEHKLQEKKYLITKKILQEKGLYPELNQLLFNELNNDNYLYDEIDQYCILFLTANEISRGEIYQIIANNFSENKYASLSNSAYIKLSDFFINYQHSNIIHMQQKIQIYEFLSKKLFQRNLFEQCIYLIEKSNLLDVTSDYAFENYTIYLKARREGGKLKSGVSIDSIYHKALQLSSTDLYKEIIIKTIYCSILEHLYRYDEIVQIYQNMKSKIDRLDPNNKDDFFAYCDYYKNLGLAYFHGDVLPEYESALKKLDEMENLYSGEQKYELFRASLLNQKGLAYFYSGKLDNALIEFEACSEITKQLMIYEETPLNSISMIYFLKGNIDKALEYHNQAFSVLFKPKFQEISICINRSLIQWKMGNTQEAKEKLHDLSNEILPDPTLLAIIHFNLGYFYFEEEQYKKASFHYAKACECEYRFLKDEYQRVQELLYRLCKAKSGELPGESVGDISFFDRQEKGTLPYNRAYQVDVNSMYIV